jgi:hypothetical protein
VAELWAVLGYDDIAAEAAKALSESADIDVIEGPPGSGKSWLAKGVGALWEAGGGSAVVVEGDEGKKEVALYPFKSAMIGLPKWSGALIPALTTFAKTGEMLVGTGGLITTTVEALAKVRARAQRNPSILLGDAERDILADLERFSREGPLLLIADNLHWWDVRSLELLRSLRDERMCESFPFLTAMRVLAVQTTERYQEVANPRARDLLLAPMTTHYFKLQPIPRDGFEEVLASLEEMEEPPSDIADAVHKLTGGHLALAKKCAERIKAGEAEALLSSSDPEEFIRRLLSERIRNLGALGAQAVTLLQVAAVLGLAFDRDEVMCASEVEEAETARLLRFCRDEKMLELTDERWVFVHDRFRRYFLGLDSADRIGIHERWSDCLRMLRPAEYVLRCLNALRAEMNRDAGTMAAQAGLQLQREGQAWRQLEPAVRRIIEDCELEGVLDAFAAAIAHVNHYRYAECLATLDGLPRDLSKSLYAEADYLRAMCLMSTRSEDDRAEGRVILEAWEDYTAQEPELGMRLMQLLLFGLTHMTDKQPGRALERRIKATLLDRVSFDVAAKDAMYTMDRCCGWLYQPDVACIRTKEAAMYFAPREGQSVLRRPLEYYRSLANYGANLICLSLYPDAAQVHEEIESLIANYPPDVFPRLDFPRTNGLLVKYRMEMINAEQASDLQRQIATSIKFANDPYYAENALAVYLTLAEHYQEALAVFDRLYAQLIASRSDPEPSMIYLLRANRAATLYVSGDQAACKAEWTQLIPIVDKIAYAIRPLLVRRHELLGEIIETGVTMSPRSFDECLVSADRPAEFGPVWQNFGHGFRMPEVEFWRDN